MAAFYTWINTSRLSGADQMTFLVWHEGQLCTALAIAPGLPGSTVSDNTSHDAQTPKLSATSRA